MIPEASVVSVVLDASGLGLLRKKPPSQGSSKTAHFFSFLKKTYLANWLNWCANSLLSLLQVYSFVPIPGAQQHKRPRRRYEEIERMYKCGWQGCEKAYGTLNHLNAHVTMQSHGAKRTPEGKFESFFILVAVAIAISKCLSQVAVANGWIGLAPAAPR